jgi:hypothetical protein
MFWVVWLNNMKKIPITYDELYDLYVNQGLSTLSIAKIYNAHHTSIRDLLIKFDISRRNISQAKQISKLNRKEHSQLFKHGLDTSGYKVYRQNGKKKKEHRVIAEKLLQRELKRQEIVHHVNGIKTDNRPENLWIFPTPKDHTKYHWDGTIHKDTIFLSDYSV